MAAKKTGTTQPRRFTSLERLTSGQSLQNSQRREMLSSQKFRCPLKRFFTRYVYCRFVGTRRFDGSAWYCVECNILHDLMFSLREKYILFFLSAQAFFISVACIFFFCRAMSESFSSCIMLYQSFRVRLANSRAVCGRRKLDSRHLRAQRS
jgi:hypothetical protein